MINEEKLYKRLLNVSSQTHAKKLDKFLGYNIPKIEVKLLQKYRAYYKSNDETNRKAHFEGTQTWIGLHPQVLQTPYNDIYEALSYFKDLKISKVVDVGAAYGRVGLVTNALFPQARFIGYEIVKKRAQEANRVYDKFNLLNCEVIETNVLDEDFDIPLAQVYFIYDFSEKEDIRRMLTQIGQKLEEREFFLIVRGERVESLLEKDFKHIWRNTGWPKESQLNIYVPKKVFES